MEAVLSFRAQNNENFSAAELLYLVPNGVVESLRDMDHHFFEGLSGDGEEAGVPLYHLSLAS